VAVRTLKFLIIIVFQFSIAHADGQSPVLAKPDAVQPIPFDFPLDEKPFIAAKNIVEVENYEAKAKIYHLKRQQFPDANGLFATPENLVAAIKTLDLAALKKKPNSIVGGQYMTDNDLLILPPEEVAKKRKSAVKSTP